MVNLPDLKIWADFTQKDTDPGNAKSTTWKVYKVRYNERYVWSAYQTHVPENGEAVASVHVTCAGNMEGFQEDLWNEVKTNVERHAQKYLGTP